ncbi:MAG TPA: NADH-quinone oxidoreductase subunit J [Bacteroidota bacterium]|nr:NADH-quinone oxidoreductase subunit J [Bacteroidota bacterium]
MNVEVVFFSIVSIVAIASALMMITRRNPIVGVLFLIVNFFCLSVLYLFLHAQFIAIVQILVYAGAIMVLFLFVIMLLNLGDEEKLAEKRSYRRILAYALTAVILFQIMIGIAMPVGLNPFILTARASEIGTVEYIGRSLYTEYLFPFEITSLLLLAAIVGVIVLAKKKFQ